MKKIFTKGFTLIEILMVLALIGILTIVSITAIESVSNDASFDQTYHRMILIRAALIGDLDTNKQGLREYFGYLGDMGALPTTAQGINALLIMPSGPGYSSYGIDSTSRTGMGWRGPYLKTTTGIDWTLDGWGNTIVYNADTTTPYILSYGSDGVAGGTGTAADIQINFPASERTSTVYGVINRNAVTYAGDATIEFYQPDGKGALSTSTQTINSTVNGRFVVSGVPFGLRSFKVTMGTDIIGPSIISVDNVAYSIPHNFLDSTPGALPHICSDLVASSYATGTLNKSAATHRVYFDVNLANSLTVNSIYVQASVDTKFKAIRIANETRGCAETCTTSSGTTTCNTTQSTVCCQRSGSSANCTGLTYNETKNFPEIALTSNWTILGGQNVGVYVEFDNSVNMANIDWVQIRLGCDMIFAQ